MAKPNFGKGRDGIYKAIGEGERTSKKVATIRKTDGTTFKRKNANQHGSAEGGNDYYEDRPNRSDKYAKGSTVASKKKEPKIVRGFSDDEEYEFGKGGITKSLEKDYRFDFSVSDDDAPYSIDIKAKSKEEAKAYFYRMMAKKTTQYPNPKLKSIKDVTINWNKAYSGFKGSFTYEIGGL